MPVLHLIFIDQGAGQRPQLLSESGWVEFGPAVEVTQLNMVKPKRTANGSATFASQSRETSH